MCIQINLCAIPYSIGLLQVKDFKLKQSWKKVYAKDHDMDVGNLRTFHLNDEEETEIEREEMVEGL